MDGSRKDPNIMVENRIIFMDRNRKMEKQNAKYVAQKDEEMFFHCTRCDAKFKLMSTLSFHLYMEHIREEPRREIMPLHLGGGEEYWM